MGTQVFKSRMRIARNRANLTQSQLSELVNIPRTTLAYYENPTNNSVPVYEVIHKLSKALKVSDNFLLGLDAYSNDLYQLIHDTLGLSETTIELLKVNKKNLDLGVSGINYDPELCLEGIESIIKTIIPKSMVDVCDKGISEAQTDGESQEIGNG